MSCQPTRELNASGSRYDWMQWTRVTLGQPHRSMLDLWPTEVFYTQGSWPLLISLFQRAGAVGEMTLENARTGSLRVTSYLLVVTWHTCHFPKRTRNQVGTVDNSPHAHIFVCSVKCCTVKTIRLSLYKAHIPEIKRFPVYLRRTHTQIHTLKHPELKR